MNGVPLSFYAQAQAKGVTVEVFGAIHFYRRLSHGLR